MSILQLSWATERDEKIIKQEVKSKITEVSSRPFFIVLIQRDHLVRRYSDKPTL